MRNVIGVLALALVSGVAAAADKPDWAFPVTEKVLPTPRFEGTRVRPAPPGSTLSITRAKADDMYDIPNWFPNLYPSMPKIVQFGNKDTQVRACGSCHLPNGTGHDESAYVAGLPAAYFIPRWLTGKAATANSVPPWWRCPKSSRMPRSRMPPTISLRSSRVRGSGWSKPTWCRSPTSARETSGSFTPTAAASRWVIG